MSRPATYLVTGRTAYWLGPDDVTLQAPMSGDGTINLSWTSPVYRTAKNRIKIDTIHDTLLALAGVTP